jgi:hypothetical protein
MSLLIFPYKWIAKRKQVTLPSFHATTLFELFVISRKTLKDMA